MNTGVAESPQVDHHFRIERLSTGSARFTLDHVDYAAPSSTWSEDAPVRWECRTGNDVIEYVFVSKVVDVPPVFSASQGEETQ